MERLSVHRSQQHPLHVITSLLYPVPLSYISLTIGFIGMADSTLLEYFQMFIDWQLMIIDWFHIYRPPEGSVCGYWAACTVTCSFHILLLFFIFSEL